MNIIELSKIMASYQRAIKTLSCKPDKCICVSRCKQNGGGGRYRGIYTDHLDNLFWMVFEG